MHIEKKYSPKLSKKTSQNHKIHSGKPEFKERVHPHNPLGQLDLQARHKGLQKKPLKGAEKTFKRIERGSSQEWNS